MVFYQYIRNLLELTSCRESHRRALQRLSDFLSSFLKVLEYLRAFTLFRVLGTMWVCMKNSVRIKALSLCRLMCMQTSLVRTLLRSTFFDPEESHLGLVFRYLEIRFPSWRCDGLRDIGLWFLPYFLLLFVWFAVRCIGSPSLLSWICFLRFCCIYLFIRTIRAQVFVLKSSILLRLEFRRHRHTIILIYELISHLSCGVQRLLLKGSRWLLRPFDWPHFYFLGYLLNFLHLFVIIFHKLFKHGVGLIPLCLTVMYTIRWTSPINTNIIISLWVKIIPVLGMSLFILSFQ